MSLKAAIRDEIAKATRRAGGAIRRALISVAPTSSFFMTAKGLTGETWPDLELWQQYGLASRPPADGEVLIVRPDSDGGEGAVAVATNDRNHRPTDLAADEVVLYGKDSTGQPTVRLKAGGDIEINPGTGDWVKVGDNATDKILKGDSYNTDHATMITALQAWLTLAQAWFVAFKADPLYTSASSGLQNATDALSASAFSILTAAFSTFATAATADLATKGKVE